MVSWLENRVGDHVVASVADAAEKRGGEAIALRTMTAVVLLALGAVLGASAATIHVYPGASIQAALNAAGTGDEVLVHPGTYNERIDFHGKAVTLRSSDGPSVTTIDGQQGGTVVTCGTAAGPGTVLDGLRITGGQGENGGGMGVFGASPTVRNCVFASNHAQYGGAVFVQVGQPQFIGCIFSLNTTDGSGAGVYFYGEMGLTAGTLRDCRFENNTAKGRGGAVRNWVSSPTIVRCVFYANHARVEGAGIANGGASSPTVTDCVFYANRTDTMFSGYNCYGGAMSNTETSSPVLVNCVFQVNSAVSLYPNLARGGGLSNAGSAHPSLVNCTFSGNHADMGWALSNSGSAQVAVSNSILWDGGVEIVNEGSATATVRYSDVQSGWAGTGNVHADPRLNELRLQSDSPCINTGDPNYAPPGGIDLDGHARVLCGRVDMGAYEFGIGDYDCDRVVDGQDFVAGVSCLTGPDLGPYGAGCEALDFEYDRDVDLIDLAALQTLLGS